MRTSLALILFCGILNINAVASGKAPGKLSCAAAVVTRNTPAPDVTSGVKKIHHVIWIIQENRSFDNYFGTFPGADGFS